MDYKQLFKDIVTFKFSSFATRYHKLQALLKRTLFFGKQHAIALEHYKNIPIIINNCNRFTYLKRMVSWLQRSGYTNLIVLDNQSTYEPLLQYYKSSGLNVIYLTRNYGHLALWHSGIYKRYYKSYYVYTDPDLEGIETCPDDFVKHFIQLLHRYPGVEKAGFGLKIDDLPDTYARKTEVVEWEKKFWTRQVEKDVFDAALDTTFAVYKPYTNGAIWVQNALRTGGNYVVRHLPWYENSAEPDAENLYYLENMKKGASHWIVKK